MEYRFISTKSGMNSVMRKFPVYWSDIISDWLILFPLCRPYFWSDFLSDMVYMLIPLKHDVFNNKRDSHILMRLSCIWLAELFTIQDCINGRILIIHWINAYIIEIYDEFDNEHDPCIVMVWFLYLIVFVWVCLLCESSYFWSDFDKAWNVAYIIKILNWFNNEQDLHIIMGNLASDLMNFFYFGGQISDANLFRLGICAYRSRTSSVMSEIHVYKRGDHASDSLSLLPLWRPDLIKLVIYIYIKILDTFDNEQDMCIINEMHPVDLMWGNGLCGLQNHVAWPFYLWKTFSIWQQYLIQIW